MVERGARAPQTGALPCKQTEINTELSQHPGPNSSTTDHFLYRKPAAVLSKKPVDRKPFESVGGTTDKTPQKKLPHAKNPLVITTISQNPST